MWPFTRGKPTYKIAELDNLVLAESRDSAGFDFGVLVRTTPAAEATVMFRVDSVLSMTDEEILAWEETIAQDSSVISCVLTSTSTGCVMSVSVARESKDERKETDEIITRLAAELPQFYDLEEVEVVATPLTAAEIESYIADALNTSTPLWPELRVEEITNTVTNWEVNGVVAASFDVLDNEELDTLLRKLVLTDEFAGVVRWARVFRPALDTEELGRHSGLLTISAPASVEQLEQVVDTVLAEMTALQRLRIRRMYARQQTGYLASLGIGVNAWEFDKVLAS